MSDINVFDFLNSDNYREGTIVEVTSPADFAGCKAVYKGDRWVPAEGTRQWLSRNNKNVVKYVIKKEETGFRMVNIETLLAIVKILKQQLK